MGDMSRREIQLRLRGAVIRELEKMDLPQHGPAGGRHLSRVARALVHEAAALLFASDVPGPVVVAVIVEAMRKAVNRKCPAPVVGAFGPVAPGKA